MRRLMLMLALAICHTGVSASGNGRIFEIPFEITARNLFIINVGIADSVYRFMFDTGASTACIKESIAESFGLKPMQTTMGTDINGAGYPMELTIVPSVTIGGVIEVTAMPVMIVADTNYLFSCLGVDGIIGSNFLRGYVAKIELAEKRLTVSEGKNPWKSKGLKPGKMRHWKGSYPHIILEYANAGGERYKVRSLFDTGNSTENIRIPETYFDENKLVCNIVESYGVNSMGFTGQGEPRHMSYGEVPVLHIGGAQVEGLTALSGKNFNLGNKILRFGDMVLDFRRSKYQFIPHGDKSEWGTPPLNPVSLTVADGYLVVGSVWDARLAGIVSAGDRIVGIDGIILDDLDSCSLFSLVSFFESLSLRDDAAFTVMAGDGTEHVIPAHLLLPSLFKVTEE